MEINKLLNPRFFILDNKELLVLYSDFLVLNLKLSEREKFIGNISNGNICIEDLEQNIDKKNNVSVIKISSIIGMYTDVKHDDKLKLVFKHFKTDKLNSKKISFINIEEKDKFISEIFSYIKDDFLYEKCKNNLLGSIRTPLKRMLQVLVFGGFLSWLAYYMETSEGYSFRVPIVFYPIVLIMEYIGYKPVITLTGILLLIIAVWAVKNMITPTEKLVIERKNIQLDMNLIINSPYSRQLK